MRMMVSSFLIKFRVPFSQLCVYRAVHLQSSAMAKNHLPDRWTEYIPVGKRIPGTRFIAFKVPLKKVFDNKLAPWQRFSPVDLVNEIGKQNEELGLVVDLTFTKRYYTPEDLPETVRYEKIYTAGHQVPTDDVIHEFKSIVKQYLSENCDNDKLVGVHCTHGLNRTGYMVCRYMIDVLGMVPSEAIEKFNKSRGHCIERTNYIEDLLHGKTRNQPCPNPSNGPRKPTPPSNGPRKLAPVFSQPVAHYTTGPPRHFHQAGAWPLRNPFPGPRVPPPGFTNAYMRDNRHPIPQMAEEGPTHHYSGGPDRRRRRRKHSGQQQGGQPADCAIPWSSAPYIPQQNGGNLTHTGYGSQRYGHDPYHWVRGEQGHRANPRHQWQ
ncbi:RNA/RNP complex-1-interacting phosphatase [Hyperolius riggenbachi]|uniref:RNA/RNP complex-1-interacting phosphatase n=1 Tax=Hyperolius riggenbachi TaxID=752182 RepID=UPI0035A32D7D